VNADIPRILVAERSSFSERGLQAFSRLGSLDALDLTQAELESLVGDYQVLVIRLGLLINQDVIDAGDTLQAVATPTTGVDHIDLAAAGLRGIAVVSLQESALSWIRSMPPRSTPLPLLSLVRHIPSAFRQRKSTSGAGICSGAVN
jgi:D-3-phosphoglycerate dehydrogenase